MQSWTRGTISCVGPALTSRSVFVRGKSAHPCSCWTNSSEMYSWVHHVLEKCCSSTPAMCMLPCETNTVVCLCFTFWEAWKLYFHAIWWLGLFRLIGSYWQWCLHLNLLHFILWYMQKHIKSGGTLLISSDLLVTLFIMNKSISSLPIHNWWPFVDTLKSARLILKYTMWSIYGKTCENHLTR